MTATHQSPSLPRRCSTQRTSVINPQGNRSYPARGVPHRAAMGRARGSPVSAVSPGWARHSSCLRGCDCVPTSHRAPRQRRVTLNVSHLRMAHIGGGCILHTSRGPLQPLRNHIHGLLFPLRKNRVGRVTRERAARQSHPQTENKKRHLSQCGVDVSWKKSGSTY